MTVPSEWLVVLPLLVPLLAGALGIVFYRQGHVQTVIGLAGALGHLAAAAALFWHVWTEGMLTMAMGTWPAPFGIAFAADTLSVSLVLLTSVIGLTAAVYGTAELKGERLEMGFHPLLSALILSVSGAFLTGDIFNLYVWFEVILISSFGLLILGSTKIQIDGAVKYAILNFLATTMFLVATGLLYGALGTLNFADLSVKMGDREMDGTMITIGLLFLLSFGMKAAIFPLFFWLPAAYHTPSAVVSAVFAGLLTKVGIYALFRTFTLVFPVTAGPFADVFLAVAVATMILGTLGALAENDLRRLVSYLVISGIGLMLVGLAVAGRTEDAEIARLSLTGSTFYIAHSILVTTALAFAAGLAAHFGGTSDLRMLSGLYAARPALAGLFLVLAFAMGGIPPLTGFWPKVFLVQASLANADYVAAVAVLLSGFLTVIAVGRAWALAFWRQGKAPAEAGGSAQPFRLAPLAVLVAMVAGGGILGHLVTDVAGQAAQDLTDPADYIDTVLGHGP